jgi:hypothetical protein
MHVERRVDVVEARPPPAERLEALARQRQEAGLVGEVDRVLREEQRAGLEPRDDPVAREDARHGALDARRAPHHEPVPATFVAWLHVVAPVRLGVDEGELRRPVVTPDLARAEVAVEHGDEAVEFHGDDRRRGGMLARP